MAEATHRCKTHDIELYGPSHIHEHYCYEGGSKWCDVEEINREIPEVPENSHFDLDN